MNINKKLEREKREQAQKIGLLFNKALKDIQIARWKTIDKNRTHPVSIARLTDFIFKDDELNTLWENTFKPKLIRAPKPEDII